MEIQVRGLNLTKRIILSTCFVLLASGNGGNFAAHESKHHHLSLQQSERNIEGDWEGTLDAGVAKLRLVLHVVRKEGGLRATLDSPDQGATGLPIDSIGVKDVLVGFEMKALDAAYEGKLTEDHSQIVGEWKQGGQAFPLAFKRAGKVESAQKSLRLQRVDAGGHGLNLLIDGQIVDSPVVILEAGFGAGIASWSAVQSGIAKFAQVISYDRAGLGQSEPGPKPRSAKQIATELHAVLTKAGIKPPYVLVGHSLGGPFVRVFAGLYPEEVVGLVLIDPSQEEFAEWIKTQTSPNAKEERAVEAAQLAQAPQGVRDESASVDITYQQARAAKLPPGIPVTLLTATQDAQMSAEARRMWTAKHKEWIATVAGGKLIVAEKSGHFIQVQEPQLVVDAIKQVVERARQKSTSQ
jgi:pimeloyl-ACP methyl ester carboxylesterase